MSLDQLSRRLPLLTDRQLSRYRREYRLYAARVELLEQEAAKRELDRRPIGDTTTIQIPSKLNYLPYEQVQ
ncbi:hypothetical protein SAMN06265337_0657 [Hymenobacter gelipurpurascens]|uniref:Uncharacterized protein n=1 Tax=Hymenobacter gelipurpurascens TaxID=89968 RepID=A0A212T8N0_9BACT|nr:hypothetical protein [Hymenobacter gelipurpurascens]SNC62375.1 hypothetical protein SAMN06265337_0657 [Hymenobacter gelipurpurascens]